MAFGFGPEFDPNFPESSRSFDPTYLEMYLLDAAQGYGALSAFFQEFDGSNAAGNELSDKPITKTPAEQFINNLNSRISNLEQAHVPQPPTNTDALVNFGLMSLVQDPRSSHFKSNRFTN